MTVISFVCLIIYLGFCAEKWFSFVDSRTRERKIVVLPHPYGFNVSGVLVFTRKTQTPQLFVDSLLNSSRMHAFSESSSADSNLWENCCNWGLPRAADFTILVPGYSVIIGLKTLLFMFLLSECSSLRFFSVCIRRLSRQNTQFVERLLLELRCSFYSSVYSREVSEWQLEQFSLLTSSVFYLIRSISTSFLCMQNLEQELITKPGSLPFEEVHCLVSWCKSSSLLIFQFLSLLHVHLRKHELCDCEPFTR